VIFYERGLSLIKKRVCVFAGDDSSPEAVLPSIDVLRTLKLPVEYFEPPVNKEDLKQGHLPAAVRSAIGESDAVLFGAASGISRPILFYLRWGLETYANVRPHQFMAGCKSPLSHPERVDYVMVRENLEELYPGREGDISLLRERLPELRDPTGAAVKDLKDGKFALRVITEKRTRQLAEFTVKLAYQRKKAGYPGRISCFTKSNMLEQTDGLFRAVVESVVKKHTDLYYDHFIVDDAARRLVASPEQFDLIIIPNLYGDILSDVGAATIGGLGLAPSACYGDQSAYFEPVHGTAPDLAGKNIINPTATLLSAAMLLDYLSLGDAARTLRASVKAVYQEGKIIPVDQGGRATTTEFCEAVKSKF
jgi:isocitrate/isopropylmalate dehydrogenase